MQDAAGWLGAAVGVVAILIAMSAVRARPNAGRRERSARCWASMLFAVVALLTPLVSFAAVAGQGMSAGVASRLLVTGILLLPLCAQRLAHVLHPMPSLRRAVPGAAIVLIALTWILPTPSAAADPPLWFVLYGAAALGYWTGVFGVAIHALAVTAHPSARRSTAVIVRRRARLLSSGAAAVAASLVLAILGDIRGQPAWQLGALGIELAGLLALWIGFSPPRVLRLLWRAPEERRLWAAVSRSLSLTSVDQVSWTLLPTVSRIVGASGAALVDTIGDPIAMWGVDESEVLRLPAAPPARMAAVPEPVLGPGWVQVPIPAGSLVLWAPAAPVVIGGEELDVVRSAAVIINLVLEHALRVSGDASQVVPRDRSLEAPSARIRAARGLLATLDSHWDDLDCEQRRQYIGAIDEALSGEPVGQRSI